MEGTEKVVVQSEPRWVFRIRSELPKEVKNDLQNFLVKCKDVFTKSVLDMLGVSREVIEHRLNSSSKVKPVVQKKRNLGKEQ